MIDDDVVHLHLEHRVVQRLLGRFIAQGFVHHDLSRACLTQTTDAIPRVILLGRLCLYGPGAARLHEELVPVTARWTDPKIRKGALTPYARESETKTHALLEEALAKGAGRPSPKQVIKQLQAAAPADVQELLDHLQTIGQEYAKDARKKLSSPRRCRSQGHAADPGNAKSTSGRPPPSIKRSSRAFSSPSLKTNAGNLRTIDDTGQSGCGARNGTSNGTRPNSRTLPGEGHSESSRSASCIYGR